MRKSLAWVLAVIMLITSVSFSGITSVFAASDNLLAFPGAEGGGKYSKGARNGTPTIYHVTNLNKSGSGSFADAISKSNRIIVFDVGGTINVDKTLNIKGNTTILGQTAPGDGITIAGGNIEIGGDNIIMRYLRVRPSDINGGEPDGIGGRWVDNVIIDHCSVSWSIDEGLTLYGGSMESSTPSTNVTMQYCLGAESLRMSNHFKGAHGYGGIWGGIYASYHHNLLAHHDSRSPRLDRNLVATEVVNNIIYDWGITNSAYGAEGHSYNTKISQPSNVNWENNYYKYGPGTKKDLRSRIFDVSATKSISTKEITYDKNLISNFYFNGNRVFGNDAVTNKNSLGISNSSYGNLLDAPISMTKNGIDYSVKRETADEAYENVLKNVGATLPKRDSIDARIVDDVRNGTGRIINRHTEVGGFIDTETVTRKFVIPQDWKDANGMGSAAENDIVGSGTWKGYTWIEAYVNDWTMQQSTPTNPHITVETPVIASTKNMDENWTVINEAEKLTYKAVITPENGTDITKVEIIDGEKVIKDYSVGELTSLGDGTYQLNETDILLNAGTHFIMSKAYNDKGESTMSPTAIVYVNSSCDSQKYSHIQIGKTEFDQKGASSINDDGIFMIGGSGSISGGSDNCDFMYREVEGDFDYVARIVDIPKFENGVLSGIMMRESLEPNSRMAMVADGWLKYGENIRLAYRTSTGKSATLGFMKNSGGSEISNTDSYESTKYPLPSYMKISRKGDTVTLAVSNSGSDWSDNSRKPFTLTMENLPEKLYIGFSVDSSNGTATRDYYTMAQFDMVTLNGETEFDYSQMYNKLPLVEEEYTAPIPWTVTGDGVSDKDMSDSAYPSSGDQKNNIGHSLYMSKSGATAKRKFNNTESGIVEISYDLLTTETSDDDAAKVSVKSGNTDNSVLEIISRHNSDLEYVKRSGLNEGVAFGNGSIKSESNAWYNYKLYFDFDARNSGEENWITISAAKYDNYADKTLSKDEMLAVKRSGIINEGGIGAIVIENLKGSAKYFTGLSVKVTDSSSLPALLPEQFGSGESDKVITTDTVWNFTSDVPFDALNESVTEVNLNRKVNVNGLTFYVDPSVDSKSGNNGMIKYTNIHKINDKYLNSLDLCLSDKYGSTFGDKLKEPKSKVIGFKVDRPVTVKIVTPDNDLIPIISTADGTKLPTTKSLNSDGTATVSANYLKLEETNIYISFENGSKPIYEISAEMLLLSGTCGDNLTWSFDGFGELVIGGSGAMTDYSADGAPWSAYEQSVKSVNIADTVTKIGANAFKNCTKLECVTIPIAVAEIGENAFINCSESLVIYGDEGSVAESCATENGITFKAVNKKEYTVIGSSNIKNGSIVFESSSSTMLWKAEQEATAGTELWTELSEKGGSLNSMIDLPLASGTVTVDDIKFTKYIGGKANGNFDDGKMSGGALKFVAPSDGTFTVYIRSWGNDKELMICEEGTDSKNEALFYKKNTSGGGINTSVTVAVERGKTYYAGVLGSKGQFLGVAFEGEPYNSSVQKFKGDTVNFRIYPDKYWELSSLNIVDSFGRKVEYVLNDDGLSGSFVMQATNIIAEPVFKAIDNIPIETGRCDMDIKSKTADGDNTVIGLEISNGTDETLSGTLIVCVRASKDEIKFITTDSITVENNKAILKDIAIKNYDFDKDIIEVYFWSDMKTMAPICNELRK